MKETFSVLLSQCFQSTKRVREDKEMKVARQEWMFSLLNQLSWIHLSWCFFNPSLVTEAKLFLQAINFAFLLFQVSDKIVDSDLQQQLSFSAAAKIRACVSYSVPQKSDFPSPCALILWRTSKDSTPSSVLGKEE